MLSIIHSITTIIICQYLAEINIQIQIQTLKRIKNYLRSTMSQDRLNSLMIGNIYKEDLMNIDLVKVLNNWVSKCGSENRKFNFGTFTKHDINSVDATQKSE